MEDINYINHFSTHKILGCIILSRKEHACAQTRELACTKLVVPDIVARGKLLLFK